MILFDLLHVRAAFKRQFHLAQIQAGAGGGAGQVVALMPVPGTAPDQSGYLEGEFVYVAAPLAGRAAAAAHSGGARRCASTAMRAQDSSARHSDASTARACAWL